MKNIGCIIMAAVVFIFFYSCTASCDAPKTNSGGSGKETNAWVTAQYHVESKLKFPKSASFPFAGAQKHVTFVPPDLYIIKSYVDAKNAFGAEIRTKFYCKMRWLNDGGSIGNFEIIEFYFDE